VRNCSWLGLELHHGPPSPLHEQQPALTSGLLRLSIVLQRGLELPGVWCNKRACCRRSEHTSSACLSAAESTGAVHEILYDEDCLRSGWLRRRTSKAEDAGCADHLWRHMRVSMILQARRACPRVFYAGAFAGERVAHCPTSPPPLGMAMWPMRWGQPAEEPVWTRIHGVNRTFIA
jgi:hypothetical protein